MKSISKINRPAISILMWALLATSTLCTFAATDKSDYAIVQSAKTAADPAWQEVLEILKTKHSKLNPVILVYENDLDETLAKLRDIHPRYTCFLTPHPNVSKEFVEQVHELARRIDQDPYTDTLWAILTGFDAANALAIASQTKPLEIEKVLAGTEIAMDKVVEGYWYSELKQNHYVHKNRGETAEALKGPADTTKTLVDALNEYKPDLVITSGHATSRAWQIGYSYRNGSFRSKAGQLYGLDNGGEKYLINSPNPKVYLAVGNCLMGRINGEDSMALAWMRSAGVTQMVAYTVPTWFGYAGWGCLDYFVEQPGRYSLAEAFFANQQALVHAMQTKNGNERGLKFDSVSVAFYGDPAWEARMATAPLHYEQKLEVDADTYTFTITPKMGRQSFMPVNTNGSQRGWRPFVQFLPKRVSEVELLEGAEFEPVITDDFILFPNPKVCDPEREYKVVFRAI